MNIKTLRNSKQSNATFGSDFTKPFTYVHMSFKIDTRLTEIFLIFLWTFIPEPNQFLFAKLKEQIDTLKAIHIRFF